MTTTLAKWGNSIEDRHCIWVLSAANDLDRGFTLFGCSFQLHASFPKMHEYLIYRQPVQPGRKCRVTSKTTDLSEELDECFLRQVFSLGDVLRHAKAE